MTNPALTAAYMRQLERLRRVAGAYALARWERLGDYDDEAAYIDQVAPAVERLQAEAAATTVAYLTTAAALGRAQRPTLPVPDVSTPRIRAGVSPAKLWHRPFMTLRMALADGAEWEAAVSRGAARAQQAATTNVQLAMQHTTARATEQIDGVTGYRRVLRGDTCPLCVAASTNTYRRGDLMPLHPGCNCGVAPIVSGERPPPKPATSEDTTTDVQVFDHDELGPTLLDAEHTPTTRVPS